MSYKALHAAYAAYLRDSDRINDLLVQVDVEACHTVIRTLPSHMQSQVDDVTQEAVIRIWQSLAKMTKCRKSISSWVDCAARCVALDAIRKQARSHEEQANPDEPEQALEDESRTFTLPGTLTEREQRIAVLLGDDCTEQEIANELGVSRKTIVRSIAQIKNKWGNMSQSNPSTAP